jgi:3-hydroxybutyryl-CoA dehydrogenase
MTRLVVLGAGTMGRGIAQVAAEAGLAVTLVDPVPGAVDRGSQAILAAWARAVDRGRLTPEQRDAWVGRLTPSTDLPAAADWVIEAVPEEADLKRSVLRQVQDRYGPETAVASNTSSIAITTLQAGLPHPDRMGGLHFFNPVPRMALVEVIAGLATGDRWLAEARELVHRLGKTGIAAPDRPGFLVNRIARPYYGEALRLVDDGTASIPAVDAVMEAAGFPMGPFRLMDLVGLDVNLAVTESVYRQTYEDPRYRPHPLQVAMVQAGRLGRKTGRGWYEGSTGPESPAIVAETGRGAPGVVVGSPAFRDRWANVAGPVADPRHPPDEGWRWIATDDEGESAEPYLGPHTVLLVDGTRHRVSQIARRFPGHAVYGLDPGLVLAGSRVVTVAGPDPARIAPWIAPLGVVPVADRVGHVFSRVVAMLVAEAFQFRPRQDPDAVDTAVRLGLNHPRGPFAWADLLGVQRVVEVLDALTDVFGDRYRPGEDLRQRMEQSRCRPT